MTRDELTEKLTEEVKARKNTALRESYLREKYFSQCVEMEKEDHKDLWRFLLMQKMYPKRWPTCGNNKRKFCRQEAEMVLGGIQSKWLGFIDMASNILTKKSNG